jgi:hypothetical protein
MNKCIVLAMTFALVITSCASSKKLASLVPDGKHDGKSFNTAVIVQNAREEEKWVVDHFPPDCRIGQTTLRKHKNKYYDIMVVARGGAITKVYFDVSSFVTKMP